MKERNLHTKEIFEQAYGERDWNWYRPLVAECIRYGKPGTWLDLGSGLGFFVECAQRYGISCIGLEGSEYAVEATKKRCPGIDIRKHLLNEKLPFEDSSISTVMCHQTIEHVSAEVAKFMLSECYRVLMKDGVILIYSPCFYDKKQRSGETHINMYTPSRLRAELESIGFKLSMVRNNPRKILGGWRFSQYLVKTIFRKFPVDVLSATANCIAFKPC